MIGGLIYLFGLVWRKLFLEGVDMNDDDDFGDLYVEDVGWGGIGILYEVFKDVGVERRWRFEDGDDEE